MSRARSGVEERTTWCCLSLSWWASAASWQRSHTTGHREPVREPVLRHRGAEVIPDAALVGGTLWSAPRRPWGSCGPRGRWLQQPSRYHPVMARCRILRVAEPRTLWSVMGGRPRLSGAESSSCNSSGKAGSNAAFSKSSLIEIEAMASPDSAAVRMVLASAEPASADSGADMSAGSDERGRQG